MMQRAIEIFVKICLTQEQLAVLDRHSQLSPFELFLRRKNMRRWFRSA